MKVCKRETGKERETQIGLSGEGEKKERKREKRQAMSAAFEYYWSGWVGGVGEEVTGTS